MKGKEIIKEYLEKNGFDGLYSDDGDCGCEVSDLMPCEADGCMNCEAGYRHPCRCGEGHKFQIKGYAAEVDRQKIVGHKCDLHKECVLLFKNGQK